MDVGDMVQGMGSLYLRQSGGVASYSLEYAGLKKNPGDVAGVAAHERPGSAFRSLINVVVVRPPDTLE